MIRSFIRSISIIGAALAVCWLLFQTDPISVAGFGASLALPFGASAVMGLLGLLILFILMWGAFKLSLVPKKWNNWKKERQEKQIRPYLEGAMTALSFKMPSLTQSFLKKIPADARDQRYELLGIMAVLNEGKHEQAKVLLDQADHKLSPVARDMCRGHLALEVKDWSAVHTFFKRVHDTVQTKETFHILFSACLHLKQFSDCYKLLKKNAHFLDKIETNAYKANLALMEADDLEAKGKKDAGLKILTKAWDETSPPHAGVMMVLLEGLLTTRKTSKAFELWQKAWSVNPCLELYLFAERLKHQLDPQKLAELETIFKSKNDWWAVLHSLKGRMAWPAGCETYISHLSPLLRQDVEQARRLAKRGAFELAWLYLMGDFCDEVVKTGCDWVFDSKGLSVQSVPVMTGVNAIDSKGLPPTRPSVVARRMMTEGFQNIIPPAILSEDYEATLNIDSETAMMLGQALDKNEWKKIAQDKMAPSSGILDNQGIYDESPALFVQPVQLKKEKSAFF